MTQKKEMVPHAPAIISVVLICIFFTFTDTNYLPIPVTGMLILTNILQFVRTGKKEQKSLCCKLHLYMINVVSFVSG